MKIAALCGVLDYLLYSMRLEYIAESRNVGRYIDDAEKTLAELRTLALARE
jgi:hypothetical protein